MLGLIILSSALLAPNRLFARLQTQPFGRALNAQWYGLLGLGKDTRLLEVGCGPGQLASTLMTYGHTVERAMQRFRRMKSLQKFASVHAAFHNHFNLERQMNVVTGQSLSFLTAVVDVNV